MKCTRVGLQVLFSKYMKGERRNEMADDVHLDVNSGICFTVSLVTTSLSFIEPNIYVNVSPWIRFYFGHIWWVCLIRTGYTVTYTDRYRSSITVVVCERRPGNFKMSFDVIWTDRTWIYYMTSYNTVICTSKHYFCMINYFLKKIVDSVSILFTWVDRLLLACHPQVVCFDGVRRINVM